MTYWESNAGYYAMDKLISAIGGLEDAVKAIAPKAEEKTSFTWGEEDVRNNIPDDIKLTESQLKALCDAVIEELNEDEYVCGIINEAIVKYIHQYIMEGGYGES